MDYGYHLAIDLGAGSGRVMALDMAEKAPSLVEIHRFQNAPVATPTGSHWNALELLRNVRTGINAACKQYGCAPLSLGVDTWGVDYTLIDSKGALLGMPYNYRDRRTQGTADRVRELISDQELFSQSGIQPLELNTLYQLLADKQSRPEVLKLADRMLFMPDLINFWLTGIAANENTIASTSGLWLAAKRSWNMKLIGRLGLPEQLFRNLAEPCSVLGTCRQISDENPDWTGVPVVFTCSHDTASAVMAVSTSPSEAIISLGSWAIVSHVMDSPGLSETAFAAGFAVEGTPAGTWRYASNHTGLWLMQRYKHELNKGRPDLGYPELEKLAAGVAAESTCIIPNNLRFTNPASMTAEISACLEETGQRVPQTPGEWTRLIYRSLSVSFADSVQQLQKVVGHSMDSIRVIGGGAEASLLCQMIANASGLPVTAGPVEATAYGNIMAQCTAIYGADSISHWQPMMAPSWSTRAFKPQPCTEISEAIARASSLE